jgi:hypothetical protein
VTHDTLRGDQRITPDDRLGRLRQHLILTVRIGDVVGAFQLDADGEVIAFRPPLEAGSPRVPGSTGQGYILDELPVAPNQEMGGYPQVGDARKVWVCARVQTVVKQVVDPPPAELARGETNAVDHQ